MWWLMCDYQTRMYFIANLSHGIDAGSHIAVYMPYVCTLILCTSHVCTHTGSHVDDLIKYGD